LIPAIKRFVTKLKDRIKPWSRPTTLKLVTEALSDLQRSRQDLIAENALLRQQLIVLMRQVKRPQLPPSEVSTWHLATNAMLMACLRLNDRLKRLSRGAFLHFML